MNARGRARATPPEWPGWDRVSAIETLMGDTSNPANPTVIVAVVGFRPGSGASFEWLRDVFARRFAVHPRLRALAASHYKLTYSLPQSTGDASPGKSQQHPAGEFDTSQHCFLERPVRDVDTEHHAPEATGDGRVRAFFAKVAELVSKPLPRDRPLWSMHFFPGIALDTPDKRGDTVVVRVHHVIGDGVALVKLFLSVADDRQESTSDLLPIPHRQNETPSTRRAANTDTAMGSHREPSALQRSWQFCTDAADIFLGTLFRPDTKTILTKTPMCGQKAVWYTTPSAIPLAAVKASSKAHNITVNDTFVTTVCGAVREYLIRFGGGVEALPKDGSFHIGIPINRHAITPDDVRVSNAVVVLPVVLPLQENALEERAQAVTSIMNYMKSGFRFALLPPAISIVGALPRPLRRWLWRHMSRRISCIFTNVPGPREKLSIGGVEIDSLSFTAPADGDTSLTLSLFSYAGKCSLGVSGDKSQLLHPAALAELMLRHLDQLCATSGEIDVGDVRSRELV